MAEKKQNTKLGAVGTFRHMTRSGKVIEFRAKTIGILSSGADTTEDAKAADAGASK